MPKKTARRIIDTKKATGTTILTGVTVAGSPGSGASAAMAGDGLTYSSGVLNVGAGTGITVAADSVSLASTVAGAGLTHSSGVLAVGAGSGITVNADDVALTTPGTLTAATSNSSASNHTHAITTGDASTLTVSTSNATGSSASLARADHLHTITSSANVTGGGTSLLASSSGNLKLATGNIGSTLGYNGTFTSGFAGAGWRVDYGVTEASKASAEFDNLTIRGRMRVYELLIQQIRATNGSVFVSSSSKVKTVTNTTNPAWTVNGVQLTLNGDNATLTFTLCDIATADASDIDGGNDRQLYHGFLVGDVTRAQEVRWDGSEFAGIIQSNLEVTSVGGLYEYGAALVYGDVPAVGYDYVRLGNTTDTTRQGTVYLTSDDSNAPFIDIVDGVEKHADWNTAGKIRARLGKLSGITDAQWGTLSGYGLWSDNVYLTGNIYATDGIFNGTVYASAGTFTGTVTASSGSIGGWSIGASALTAGSGSSTVGLDTGGTNPAIYAGSATPGSAPFRVTQAGALTATNATITGAITASSGSITGNFYAGSNAMRLSTDGQRFVYDSSSSINVYNSSSAIRWFESIDTTFTSADNYAGIIAYENTFYSPGYYDVIVDNYVGSGDYSTRTNRVILRAGSFNGSSYTDTYLIIAKTPSQRLLQWEGDVATFSGILHTDEWLRISAATAPSSNPASGAYIYVDSADGDLKVRFANGTVKTIDTN